jgi:hypothetical protein
VVVSPVELVQLSLEVSQRRESDLCYQVVPQDLVVSLDLAPSSLVVRLAEDGFDMVLGQLGLELLRDELTL